MSRVTSESMHAARDEEDRRLLAAGEFSRLIESYYGVMLDRCRARVRYEDQAIAVAAEVAIRLLSELKMGKTYRYPFRVVVHKVIGWKISEHYEPAKISEAELLDDIIADGRDPIEEVLAEYDFDRLLSKLPQRQREVLDLLFMEGRSPEQVAEQLGITRNAVDQARHRALERLREELKR